MADVDALKTPKDSEAVKSPLEASKWKVLMPLCGAGLGGIVCGIFDFIWTSPAFSQQGEPAEARTDPLNSGEVKILRILALVFCASQVFTSGAAILAIEQDHSISKALVRIHMLVSLVLAVVVHTSNRLASWQLNRTMYWQGPYWTYTQHIFMSTLAMSLLATHRANLSHKPKRRMPQRNNMQRQTAGVGGCILCLAGLGLLVLGTIFYLIEPSKETYGSLNGHLSYLEWQCGGGAFNLNSPLQVVWGPEVGLRIGYPMGKTILRTVGPRAGFLIASLNQGSDSAVRLENFGDAGTFQLRDNPGRFSTEQIIEQVEFYPDEPAMVFRGSLFFGPLPTSHPKTSPSHSFRQQPMSQSSREPQELVKTSFRFVVNASRHEDSLSLKADEEPGIHIRFSAYGDEALIDRLYFVVGSDEQENLYGLGESFTYMNLKGGQVPILAREQGIGRGLEPLSFVLNAASLLSTSVTLSRSLYMPWSWLLSRGEIVQLDTNKNIPSGSGLATGSTYTAIPHVTTSFLRSLYLSSYGYSVFDFSENDRISIEIAGYQFEGGVIEGKSPFHLIDTYTAQVAGHMRMLPEWTQNGAIVGMQGGRAAVMEKLDILLNAGTPVAAIWLQDWSGQHLTSAGSRVYWNWEVDHTLYPDWYKWSKELFQLYGIRIVSYVNAHLSEDGPMFKRAKACECLIMRKNKPLIQWSASPSFRFGTVNIFSETCAQWFIDILRENLLGSDLSHPAVGGWMADFGENLPFDVASPDAHNRFPERWAELNQRVIASAGIHGWNSTNLFMFTRSASLCTPRFTSLQWMGDQLPTWDNRDGLQSVVVAQLAGGLSGLAHTHSDIGGFTMIEVGLFKYLRTPELMQRWIEHSSFADSVFRSHEGLLPESTLQVWNASVIQHFVRFAHLHRALGPMRTSFHSQWPGRPWMQSMWLHYPDDPMVANLKTQYFLGGPKLLVCPVLGPSFTSVPCYLPGNSTYSHVFFPNVVYHGEPGMAGRHVDCPATLGSPCVLTVGRTLTMFLRDLVNALPTS